MTKRTVYLLAILFFGLETHSFAQDTSTTCRQRYFTFGAGITGQSFYDEAISNIWYSNTGMAPLLGHFKIKNGHLSQLLIEPSFLSLRTKRSGKLTPMKVSTVRVVTDYQLLYDIDKWSKRYDVKLGGLASLVAEYKEAPQLDNSAIVYDYALSLGVSGRAARQVRVLKHDAELSLQLSMPLIAHAARPQYLNRIEFLDPENDLLGDVFSNAHIVTLNKYLRVNSQLALRYHLNSGNDLRLAYHWDFYRLKDINRVFATEHLVSFMFMFRY
ncbi:hypothetical protein [Polluticoccus soli]|uniref:hypothetical protein n=1 Tax=Polluticoccus soli TaxID=3034150 RepID=UPI0023E24034|nr:hypothetical protein [Flavipsychrobacter sp. JY13-12]